MNRLKRAFGDGAPRVTEIADILIYGLIFAMGVMLVIESGP